MALLVMVGVMFTAGACASPQNPIPTRSQTPSTSSETSNSRTDYQPVTPSTTSAVPTPKVTTTAPATAKPKQAVGVSIALGKVANFEQVTGTTPDVLMVYQSWAGQPTVDAQAYAYAAEHQTQLVITWQPWDPTCNCANQPDYSDRKIADGDYDAYLKAYADSVVREQRALGGSLTIRLAHEQNGNWYPWSPGVNGNSAADYIAMWRHVHDIFASEHADVQWMWSPNADYYGAHPMNETWPGSRYVDQVGLSGYNFGPGKWSRWTSFAQIYDKSLNELRAISHKPLWLAEIASTSDGGSKAAWIADMFRQVKARPYIAGLIWFDQSPAQENWVIETDPQAVAAWQHGTALVR